MGAGYSILLEYKPEKIISKITTIMNRFIGSIG
jgi:hypothetical protein